MPEAATVAPSLATSDWAVVGVALISGFFAWLATFVTNRRAQRADKLAEPVVETTPHFPLDIRDGVFEMRTRIAVMERRLDTIEELSRDAAEAAWIAAERNRPRTRG